MAIVINGSGTVTGLAVGGLPDGTVDAGTLATNAVTAAKLEVSAITGADLPAGTILQVKFVEDNSSQTVATDTNNGAATNLSIAITPIATSSKILALWNMQYEMPNSNAGTGLGMILMRGSSRAWQSGYTWVDVGSNAGPGKHRASWQWLDSPSTASAVTYTINAITEGGNGVTLNTNNNKSQLTRMEIKG